MTTTATETRRVKKCYRDETRWAVVGEHGAVEFHCFNRVLPESRWRVGGFEEHLRKPQHYRGAQSEPDHDYCELLDGPCWHDGTSLWASEYWIPLYEREGEEAVWRRLEQEYARRLVPQANGEAQSAEVTR